MKIYFQIEQFLLKFIVCQKTNYRLKARPYDPLKPPLLRYIRSISKWKFHPKYRRGLKSNPHKSKMNRQFQGTLMQHLKFNPKKRNYQTKLNFQSFKNNIRTHPLFGLTVIKLLSLGPSNYCHFQLLKDQSLDQTLSPLYSP